MEQSIPQRNEWVSRILAVISALWGMKILIVQFWQNVLPCLQAANLRATILSTLFTGLWGTVFILIAVLLWKHDKAKYIPRWAMFISALLFQPAARIVFVPIQAFAEVFLPAIEATRISYGSVHFFALLSAGILYLALKRLLYYWLKEEEYVDPVWFPRSRKIYFGSLAFTFWLMLGGGYFSVITTRHPDPKDPLWPVFSILGILMPLGLAVCFYLVCAYLFISQRLKADRKKPEGLEA